MKQIIWMQTLSMTFHQWHSEGKNMCMPTNKKTKKKKANNTTISKWLIYRQHSVDNKSVYVNQ